MLKILIFQEGALGNFWIFCCWDQNSDHFQNKTAIECTFSLYHKAMSGSRMPEIWAKWAKVERFTQAIACFVFLLREDWPQPHSSFNLELHSKPLNFWVFPDLDTRPHSFISDLVRTRQKPQLSLLNSSFTRVKIKKCRVSRNFKIFLKVEWSLSEKLEWSWVRIGRKYTIFWRFWPCLKSKTQLLTPDSETA